MNIVMNAKSVAALFVVAILTGCPPPSWHQHKNVDDDFSITDDCVQNLESEDGVTEIIKSEALGEVRPYYILETTHGLAHMNVYKVDAQTLVNLVIRKDGRGNRDQEEIMVFLDSLLNKVKKACAGKTGS